MSAVPLIARVAPDPVVEAERIVAEAALAPVWAEILATRGVLCPVCRRRFESALSLLTHQTAARHWRRAAGRTRCDAARVAGRHPTGKGRRPTP